MWTPAECHIMAIASDQAKIERRQRIKELVAAGWILCIKCSDYRTCSASTCDIEKRKEFGIPPS